MPPILILELMSCRRRTWKEWIYGIIQLVHFLIVMVYLWAGLVEFIRNPPYFDAYGDASTRDELPEGLFENDPRALDKTQSHRLMDLPILFMLLVYFVVCWWMKFKGLSWLLTICFTLNVACFFFVNYWSYDFFDWRYFTSRNNGLVLQIVTISLTFTSVFIVLFYERRKMPFKFKSTLPITPFGKIHVLCNFSLFFLIIFTCLMMWFSKLYISWACFRNKAEVMTICEKTNVVQCYPCNTCSPEGLKNCVKTERHKMFHCLSDMNVVLADKGAFCLFNYNISIYTFMGVTAYVGGLVVFMSTFFRIVVHYILRGVYLFVGWWKLKLSGRDVGYLNPDANHSSVLTLQEDTSSPLEYVGGPRQREEELASLSRMGGSPDNDSEGLVEAVTG